MQPRNDETRYTLNDMQSWRDSFRVLPSQIKILDLEIKDAQAVVDDYESKISQHEAQKIKPLSEKLAKTQLDIYCFTLHGRINRAQERQIIVKKQLSDANAEIKAIEVQQARLNVESSSVKNRIKIKTLDKEIAERVKASAHRRSEQPAIEQEINELQEKANVLDDERTAAEQQMAFYQQQLEMHEPKLIGLKAQKNSIDATSQSYQAKSHSASGGYSSSAVSGYQSSYSSVSQGASLEAAIAEKEEQIRICDQHIRKFKQVLRANQRESIEVKEKIKARRNHFSRNQKRISLDAENMKFSKKQIEEYDPALVKLARKSDLQELTHQDKQLNERLINENKKHAQKAACISKIQQELHELSEHISKWQKDVIEHKDLIDQLHQDAVLSVLQSRENLVANELADLRKEKTDLQKRLKESQYKLSELKQRRISLNKTLESNTSNQYLTMLDKNPDDLLHRLITDVNRIVEKFEADHAYSQSLSCRLFLDHLKHKFAYYISCKFYQANFVDHDEAARQRYYVLIGMLVEASMDINVASELTLSQMMDEIFYSHSMNKGEMISLYLEENAHHQDKIKLKRASELIAHEANQYKEVMTRFVLNLNRLDGVANLAVKEVKNLGFDLVDDLKALQNASLKNKVTFKTKYYTSLLSAANDLLLDPCSSIKREAYQCLIKQHPVETRSLGFKIGGVAMMLLGAILAVSAILVGVFALPVAAPLYCSLATGAVAVAGIGSGFGLFHHGKQPTMYENIKRLDSKIMLHQEKLINQAVPEEEDMLSRSVGLVL